LHISGLLFLYCDFSICLVGLWPWSYDHWDHLIYSVCIQKDFKIHFPICYFYLYLEHVICLILAIFHKWEVLGSGWLCTR
jgi:hypothetical protein